MRLAIAAVAACLAIPAVARAQAVINLYQDGSNVDMTLSGSINLSGLTFVGSGEASSNGINPGLSEIFFTSPGGLTAVPADFYRGFTGPSGFGTSEITLASSEAGSVFVLYNTYLVVSQGYLSGTALSSTEVFDNTTLAGLGAAPGIYDYTWTGGFVQIDIGQDVPEPAALSLMAVGVALVGVIGRRRSRQAAA